MSIKEKTLQGLTWNSISQVGKLVSQLIITAILARLLAPGDFGLIGMATVFTGFASIFNNMGLSGALIQKQDIDEDHLSSVFWFQVCVGWVLMVVMMLASSGIARFYRVPRLQPMLMVMSVNFVLSSFIVVQQSILTKNLDFKKLAVRDVYAVIIAGIVAIVTAYAGCGAWSLVYQMLVFTAINGILLWNLSPWRPRAKFSRKAIKEIFPFSAHLTGADILYYFSRNIDYLLIGRFLGAEPLGYYTLAYKIMLVPIQNISWVITKVLFPVFSKIQNDLEKIRRVYLKTVKAIALVTFPMMFVIIGIAPELITVLFGVRWQPSVFPIQVLSLCGAIQAIVSLNSSVNLARGKANIQLYMIALSTLLSSAAIVIGLRWGIRGVAIGYTLQGIVYSQIALYVLRRLIHLDSKLFYSQLATPLLIGAALLACLAALHSFVHVSARAALIQAIILSAVLYLGLLLATKEVIFRKKRISLGLFDEPQS